ncbi:autotransporter outer membrane beta-barrel domain-containing protein [Yersinia rochesterensis]|uniref:autotransporter family protein n=1 Tax=Yersinia rochesterensis TaxID=1604335 RepID=UPI001F231AEC|nr:autotransporter outer membrane beta-barrel domain-containing protein [Yersinia rochesterensis]
MNINYQEGKPIMYISNLIQPDGHKEKLQSTHSHLSPHRMTSCAKAISALLLVLGSTAAWADTSNDSRSNPQQIQYIDQQEQQAKEQWAKGIQKNWGPIQWEKWAKKTPKRQEAWLERHWKRVRVKNEELLKQQIKAVGIGATEIQLQIEKKIGKTRPEAAVSLAQDITYLPSRLGNTRTALADGRGGPITDLTLSLIELPEPISMMKEEAAIILSEKSIEQTLISIATQSEVPGIFLINLTAVQPLAKANAEKEWLKKMQIHKTEAETATGAATETATGAVAKPDAKAKTAKKALSSPPTPPPAQVPKAVPKPAPVISHNPQVGSYIANQIAAQQMFITDDLQYRQGETRYIDPVTGEEKVSSLWINTSGAKNRFNSGNGQLRTKSNRYAIQLGGTINKWSSGGDDQGILGITAGFGKSTNHSHSTSSHHQAQGSVDGYNLGLYSIWYADNQTRLGPYIDLLTQYGWFNNQVKAPNVTTAANYKSYLFTSALETGYKIQLLETADTKLSIQPRAKVMWQRTSGLLHQEPNAILINVEEDNAVTTKLGMRTVLEFNIDTLSSAKNLQISPSFEANWIHSRVNQGVQLSRVNVTPRSVQNKIELASVNVSPQGNNNIADLKLGIEANIDSNLRLWTHLGHQFGGHNYNDTQVTLGANYRF